MAFVTSGPNEAMVLTGCCQGSKGKIIIGGRAFYMPCIMQLDRLSLNTMPLVIETVKVYTHQGVPISVTGVAQVKVQAQSAEMLETALELFLGRTEREISSVATETLEGHQRAIMGTMTIEEIFQDRQKFSKAVFDMASTDLVNMGLSVVSYTLKDIRDDCGYLQALGMPRTAQVKRDARIGEADAMRDAGIKSALAEQEKADAEFSNKSKIAEAKRDYELRQADNLKEVNTQKAKADMAYELQAAKNRQLIMAEEMQIKVIERKRQIELQEQEVDRRQRELEWQVNKPAEAERFRTERLAEAKRKQLAEQALADAESLKLKGEADAFAIQAKGEAEAKQMALKAAAWNEYKEAAIADMVLAALPKIAAEVATPLAQMNSLTLISSGDSEVGAKKLTGEVMDVMERLPLLVKSMTGVDISRSIGQAQ